MFSSTDYIKEKHGSDNHLEPEVTKSANSSVYSCRFNLKPNVGDPATWLVATYRIPALKGKCVYGYAVKSLVTGGQELTSLTVDKAKSGAAGVLKGVKLASTGTLNLVNVVGKAPTGDLPPS